MAGTSLWAANDPLTRQRLNRGEIIGRLMMPFYDVDSAGTTTVAAIAVDGDDIITSATTHYTVPSSGVVVAVLQRVTVCNASATARACSIHLVESGGSRTVSNRIWSDTVPAGLTIVIEGPFFMSPSDTLQSIGTGMSADDIGLRAEALEFTTQPSGMTLAHATTNGTAVEGAAMTGSSATYYTAPTSKKTVIPCIVLCNTDTSAVTVTVNIIESGGSVAGKKKILGQSIKAGGSLILAGPFALDAGDTIRGLASTAVSIRVTAVECD